MTYSGWWWKIPPSLSSAAGRWLISLETRGEKEKWESFSRTRQNVRNSEQMWRKTLSAGGSAERTMTQRPRVLRCGGCFIFFLTAFRYLFLDNEKFAKKNESPAAFFLFLFVSLDSKVLLRGYVTLCWKTIKCSVFRCPGNASISSVLWFCLRFLATKRKTGERKKMGQTHFGYQATETESKSQRDNEESYGSSLSRQGSIKKKQLTGWNEP